MNYTIQLYTESGNFAAPEGKDVIHCTNKADILWELERWQDEVHQYDEAPCGALVWRGVYRDVTDLYPDNEATLGPRGGLRLQNV